MGKIRWPDKKYRACDLFKPGKNSGMVFLNVVYGILKPSIKRRSGQWFDHQARH